MSKTLRSKYEDRISTLKRRRDFLAKRIADYKGKDPSRDKAESYALTWAIRVIEANSDAAFELMNDSVTEEQ
jgi:hypothetical protein